MVHIIRRCDRESRSQILNPRTLDWHNWSSNIIILADAAYRVYRSLRVLVTSLVSFGFPLSLLSLIEKSAHNK